MGWKLATGQKPPFTTTTSQTPAAKGQAFQPLKALFLCIAAATLLTPSVAIAEETKFRLSAEDAPHLVCAPHGDQLLLCEADPDLAVPTRASAQTLSPTFLTQEQQNFLANLLIGLAYSIPIGTFCGILIYDRYCVCRAKLLQQQVQRLERAWQQSIRP